ncbi:MAG: adenylate cyclase [Parcubacteria group bacterium Gr01-1014_3]|nr:MAG: adenylate cyclase [Parcubacteria group bacterium Gr01-1014_3]
MPTIKNILVSIGIATLAGIIVSVSFSNGLFIGLENFFEDILVSSKPIHKDLVLVAIDNESIAKIGQWPWPRQIFADALWKLTKNPPKAVGLDVVLSEASRLGPTDDLILENILQSLNYPIILPAEGENLTISETAAPKARTFLRTLPRFTKAKMAISAHVNLILDADGVVRRFPLNISGVPAFAYALITKAGMGIPLENLLGDINRIVFSGSTGSVRRIPFWRLLEGDGAELLAGKIVVIGATAADLHDEKPTPFSRGTQMPGAEIQAQIGNMLLSGYRLLPLKKPLMIGWILIASLFPAICFLSRYRFLRPFLVILGVAALQLVATMLFFDRGVVINILHVNSAWILSSLSIFAYRHFTIEKEKHELQGIFSRYVSKEVLDHIMEDPSRVRLGGEEKEITVFFSDIRGFTTLSEKISPTELVSVLNRYFSLMTEEVLRHGGVLDKYIGDAIMAFWGAPIDDPNQADNAMKASLGMLEKLKFLNKELRDSGKPEINIGIGLYTGTAVAGNIGSESRLSYTVMGDTVNVASRLEGLNKEYKTQLIIGETTKNKLQGNYKLKSLGSASVKGRVEQLNIFTLE